MVAVVFFFISLKRGEGWKKTKVQGYCLGAHGVFAFMCAQPAVALSPLDAQFRDCRI